MLDTPYCDGVYSMCI